jgi:formate hydrogenlyase subunit 6/NADH:ubiquinone oxidoreductase subunit I
MRFNTIDAKGIISPFLAITKVLEHPKTVCYPAQKKAVALDYRGFHTNVLASCIGCASCQDVCMNDAIDMVTIEEEKNSKNKSACIPRIDYGRCCWCNLCVDVCPPGSLALGQECIHADNNSNNFLFFPKDNS